MSAECHIHGVDLRGDTFSGLVCPLCEADRKLALAEKRVAELEAELEIPVPRRGHYADMEVCAEILKSDPRDRASGYDANPRQMGEALQAIIDKFSPAGRAA